MLLQQERNRALRQVSTSSIRNGTLYCRAKLDSHANTCGVNNVTKILEYPGQVTKVSGFL